MIVVSGLAVVFAAALPWSALGLAAAWAAWAPSTGLLLLVGVCGSLPGAALGTGRLAPGPAAALALGLLSWGIWHLPESVAARRAFAAWRAQQAPLVGLASRGWL
jgi:hypothetical protein